MSNVSRRDFLKIAAYSSSAVLTSRLLAASRCSWSSWRR
jgi:hypothetical protein